MSTLASDTTEVSTLGLVEAPPAGSQAWRRLLAHPSARVGIGILLFFVLATIVGPLIFRSDPTSQDLGQAFQKPSPRHLLGTDDLGRDELERLFYGARYTLTLALAAVVLGLLLGLPFGALSRYFCGWCGRRP